MKTGRRKRRLDPPAVLRADGGGGVDERRALASRGLGACWRARAPLLKLPTAILSRVFWHLSLQSHHRLCAVSRHFHTVGRLPSSSPCAISWSAPDDSLPPPSFCRLRPTALEWHHSSVPVHGAGWLQTIANMGPALRSLTFTNLPLTFTDWTPVAPSLCNLTALDYATETTLSVAPLARFMPCLATLVLWHVTFSELFLLRHTLTRLTVRKAYALGVSISAANRGTDVGETDWGVFFQLSRLEYLRLDDTVLSCDNVVDLCRACPDLATVCCDSLQRRSLHVHPDALTCTLGRLECPRFGLCPSALAEVCMFPHLEALLLSTCRTLEPRHFINHLSISVPTTSQRLICSHVLAATRRHHHHPTGTKGCYFQHYCAYRRTLDVAPFLFVS